MKNYKQVVKERYDEQKWDGNSILKNMYSIINPIGFYGEMNSAKVLSKFVNMFDHTKFDSLKILDCGCGEGVKTRILAELLGNPSRVYGCDYSIKSIEHCKNMNPNIHYEHCDLTKAIPYEEKFDGITSFVVFMHFMEEQEIQDALKNINNSLKEDGLFLWYDTNVKHHFEGVNKETDGWGFSTKEMDQYAEKAGFELLNSYGLYLVLPLVKMTTIYMVKNIDKLLFLEFLNRLPFKKNNNVRVYRKKQ